ncbi:hypothetical protein J132_03314 [Termitomyces sp. J132]|nr:hypothetical protein H2248_003099 [Termitomyces sp. 'cryptogamus']KNZ81020.1 hypothetical protein J132_03314 [Termitomyces sp. J132]
MRFSTLLTLSLATITLAYPVVRDEVVSPHVSDTDIVDIDKTKSHGSLGNVIITPNLAEYERLWALGARDQDIEERNRAVKRGGRVCLEGEWLNFLSNFTHRGQDALTRAQIAALEEYLAEMPVNGVEAVYKPGQYAPWHGDCKSQVAAPGAGKSAKNAGPCAYQTKTILTSTDPAIYRTIVTSKGQSNAHITYEAAEWESARVIVKALLAAL